MTQGRTRIRLRFTKQGKVRFLSHRDVARVWERTLRRAGLPVAYTEGFSPRPKLSFGLALSTGHESGAEYLDVELATSHDLADIPDRVTAELPLGMEVTAVAELAPGTPSLQQAVTSCTWEIALVDTDRQTVANAVARALAAETLMITRERKGKTVTDDIRPLVHSLVIDASRSPVVLTAELGTQPRAIRPTELLGALALPPLSARVRRTHQWIDAPDARHEPLTVGPPSAASPVTGDAMRREPDVRLDRGAPPGQPA